jgi:uncharacterized protein (TIGR02145 family)
MKHSYIIVIVIFMLSSIGLNAQTTMNIYQSNGSVLQIPLNTIDSITYTINNPGQLATITTLPIGNIANTTATSGGNITNNGGTSVTQRGVVWSTSPNPTTANNQSNDGSGTGNYTSNLTGLTPNTTYYVRAYAINSAGTSYGNELNFTTTGGLGSIASLNCNSATNNGTLIAGTAASGVSSSVPYTGGNGGTYNSQTVNSTGVTGLTATLTAGNFVNGSGSLTYTITGTPSTSGTASFALNIGGQNCSLSRTVNSGSIAILNCNSATNTGTLTAGTAASGVSSSVPYTGGNGGTYNSQTVNSTGVTGLTATLTAGNFVNGSGSLTYTITGTPSTSGTASFALNIGGQNCSLSRTVNSGSIDILNCNSATNNGTLLAGTAASGVSSSVPYTGGNGGTYNGQTVNSTGVTGLTATLTAGNFVNGSGSLTYTITGTPIASGTASFALNIGGQNCILNRTVGSIVSNPGSGVTFNGYTYSSIVLGNGQEWMAENLRTTVYANGDPIPNVTNVPQWDNLTTGAWAHYNNDSQYESPYGKIYNWYTVADPRNVCPTGWHVPSDAEWSTFINYLDPNADGGDNANTTAGGKMKSTGTQYWLSPNTDATNESDFSGLPGGILGGTFSQLGYFGYWWCSTSYSSLNAYFRSLSYSVGNIGRGNIGKKYGFSVRCLKD